MIEQIDHINIVVSDLQRMTAFYRDLLGLKITKEVTISGQWINEHRSQERQSNDR